MKGQNMLKSKTRKADWRKKYWKDKYGNMFLPKDMEDYHILCAMKCCQQYTKDREHQRRTQLSAIANDSSLPKSVREDATAKLRQLEREGLKVVDEFPIYSKLCAEAMKRGLI
jgi:murein L,D-transpeptidase YafK